METLEVRGGGAAELRRAAKVERGTIVISFATSKIVPSRRASWDRVSGIECYSIQLLAEERPPLHQPGISTHAKLPSATALFSRSSELGKSQLGSLLQRHFGHTGWCEVVANIVGYGWFYGRVWGEGEDTRIGMVKGGAFCHIRAEMVFSYGKKGRNDTLGIAPRDCTQGS